MRKTSKFLIAAGVFAIIGTVLLGAGIGMGGQVGFTIDSTGISSNSKANRHKKPSVLEKTKLDTFENMDIKLDNAAFTIIPSDGYYLEYQTSGGNDKPKYSVENSTFTFAESSYAGSANINFFDISFTSDTTDYYVNLYVPADTAFKTVKLSNDYGNISLPSLKASTTEIVLDDGKLTFETIASDDLIIKNDYGDILGDTLTGKNMRFTLSDGDLECESLQTDTLKLTNDYGNTSINLLNSGNSKIVMEDGDFHGTLGKITSLDINNSYGNIDLKLADKLDAYRVDLHTDYGNIKLPDNKQAISDDDDDEVSYKNKGDQSQRLTLNCDDGDIDLTN